MLKIELSYRGMVAAGMALLTLWALVNLFSVFLLVVTAFIFMAALLPYVEWLCRHGFNRIVAVLLILLGVLVTLGTVIAIVAPAMFDEFRDLRSNLPEYAEDFEDFMSDLGFETDRWDLPERAESIEWSKLISGSQAVNFGQRAVFGIFSGLTVAVLTAYLLVDAGRLRTFVFRFIPRGREPDAQHFMNALSRVVGGYVRGQLITSLIIGLYTTAVLLIVGVPNAVAFGVLAAFADIIPLVGAFIAIVPAVVAAFQESPTQAVIVLAALLFYQQFEDRYLVPRIYGQTLNLPALVVLVAVLIGGELMGIAGVLLALPTAAAIRVVLDYYLDRREGGTGIPESLRDGEVLAPDKSPAG
ncbi:MAG: AI-2E family transporter [Dehalococcoidia bacterium]|uniref:AI-2E family transporter n=1 Tax=Candidatus Amarobacter glycogenicus TaxID=3140699 RepID=UPI00313541F8|nr:AI-2E family transporter [Dehalococcoidia bacterium]MBK7327759.1 AI-2E family transporter [Dehalococcoidia bacterium]